MLRPFTGQLPCLADGCYGPAGHGVCTPSRNRGEDQSQTSAPRPQHTAPHGERGLRTAPHACDEDVPLSRCKPEDSTPRVLTVPNMNASTRRCLKASAATIAAPTASPLSARVAIVVDNIISTRHGGSYYALSVTLVGRTRFSQHFR